MNTEHNRIGVDIVQPIVPEYRVALFDGLAEEDVLDVAIHASERMGHDSSVPLNKAQYDYGHRMICFGRFPLYWQVGLRLTKALKKGDVLVVCGDLHQLSTFPLILRARAKGVGVVWWGHHISASPQAVFVAIRLAIARILADCILCYTSQGRQFLLQRGFDSSRVYATGNTIDLKSIEDAVREWTPERLDSFKDTHGLKDVDLLIFSSVLRRKTRLDVLVRALVHLCSKRPRLKCVVIGDGEIRKEYQSLAQDLGVDEHIVWVGELREQKLLAPWFLSASAYVYPGPIGLSLIHAFAYGLPVVVNDNALNHGPEYAVFENEKNGLVFRENDPAELASVVERLISAANKAKNMGESGRRVVFHEYSMSQMIARFKEAVLACSQIKLARGKGA